MTGTSVINAPPVNASVRAPGWEQSLGDGAPGIALLQIERARAGATDWRAVHRLATAMTRQPVNANARSASLFWGAPAVAYALHTAEHPAYRTALNKLDQAIEALIRLRLGAAHRRVDDGLLPRAREYDLINGLTGLGAYFMHRYGDHHLLREVLTYLVRLTRPIRDGRETLPGWWAAGSPDRRRSPRWREGHASFGMAHGIAGPLALLSATMRQGIVVDGQDDAIHTICDWFDQWRHGHGTQAWWPEVIDRAELRSRAVVRLGPHRPSWCYGNPGIARAQQLAAIATDDPGRARMAEQALVGCLTDERQHSHFTDAGLCHGWAGLVHTARRAAADASTSELDTATRAAAIRTREHLRDHGPPAVDGLLEGTTGIDLVDATYATTPSATQPAWDTCLLLT